MVVAVRASVSDRAGLTSRLPLHDSSDIADVARAGVADRGGRGHDVCRALGVGQAAARLIGIADDRPSQADRWWSPCAHRCLIGQVSRRDCRCTTRPTSHMSPEPGSQIVVAGATTSRRALGIGYAAARLIGIADDRPSRADRWWSPCAHRCLTGQASRRDCRCTTRPTSQMSPEPGSQIVVAGATTSAGHSASARPLHDSSGSQMIAGARPTDGGRRARIGV